MNRNEIWKEIHRVLKKENTIEIGYKNNENTLEFVTGGVELLKGHCTDIPTDQGSWKRICAFCSF